MSSPSTSRRVDTRSAFGAFLKQPVLTDHPLFEFLQIFTVMWYESLEASVDGASCCWRFGFLTLIQVFDGRSGRLGSLGVGAAFFINATLDRI